MSLGASKDHPIKLDEDDEPQVQLPIKHVVQDPAFLCIHPEALTTIEAKAVKHAPALPLGGSAASISDTLGSERSVQFAFQAPVMQLHTTLCWKHQLGMTISPYVFHPKHLRTSVVVNIRPDGVEIWRNGLRETTLEGNQFSLDFKKGHKLFDVIICKPCSKSPVTAQHMMNFVATNPMNKASLKAQLGTRKRGHELSDERNVKSETLTRKKHKTEEVAEQIKIKQEKNDSVRIKQEALGS